MSTWWPNQVARQLPDPSYFAAIWVVGLEKAEAGELRYAGAVGTGWNESTAFALKKRLDAIAIPKAPVAGLKAKGAVWTAPMLRVEIAYRGLTATGELRAGSFKGLREEG
jgi:bifunctional non-homologous end joining protein LigD